MIRLSVCVGTSCHLNGANNVVMTFRHLVEEHNLHDKVTVCASFCSQACSRSNVSIKVNDEKFAIEENKARAFFREKIIPLVED